MKKLTKRALVRLAVFLGAAILALGIFAAGAALKAKDYERKTEAAYEKSLAEAVEYISDMKDVFIKGLYSESAQNQASMCADLWMDAYEAKNAISSLPISDIDMSKCYTFFSKSAEYAKSLEKQIASGKKINAEQHKTLLSLQSKCAALQNNFSALQNMYLNTDAKISGGIDFSFAVPKTISSSPATMESLNSVNKNLSNTPKLIYDGPFSDNIPEGEAKALKNFKKVSLKKATAVAEKFLEKTNGNLQYTGKSEGNIPCYCFKKGNCTLDISIKGGKVVNLNSYANVTKEVYNNEQCLKSAAYYLKKLGFKNMTCAYYERKNGVFTANFNYVGDGVYCYTDLIKIKINTANCKVLGLDTSNYLTNHTKHNFSGTRISEASARRALSPYLKVKGVKKALIPTEYGKELLCYEFKTIGENGTELLVYINSRDGSEADILILQIDKNGVLTR